MAIARLKPEIGAMPKIQVQEITVSADLSRTPTATDHAEQPQVSRFGFPNYDKIDLSEAIIQKEDVQTTAASADTDSVSWVT